MNQEQKETIERAMKLQEEFQKLGENIEPMWMLLSEVRDMGEEMRGMREEMREGMRGMREEVGNFRSELRTAIIGFGIGIMSCIIAFGIAILVHVI